MVNKNRTYSWYLSRVISGCTDYRQGCLGSQKSCLFVGSLIALVPVLLVKDTGKSSKRVKPCKTTHGLFWSRRRQKVYSQILGELIWNKKLKMRFPRSCTVAHFTHFICPLILHSAVQINHQLKWLTVWRPISFSISELCTKQTACQEPNKNFYIQNILQIFTILDYKLDNWCLWLCGVYFYCKIWLDYMLVNYECVLTLFQPMGHHHVQSRV